MNEDLIRIIFHQQKRILELEEEKKLLIKLNKEDFLTRTLNRKSIFEFLTEKIKGRKKYEGICVAMIDVDYFKKINDTYGHQVGDQVLKEVADRMKKALREEDQCGRYGGEEFLIVLSNCETSPHGAMKRLLQAINNRPIRAGGEDINVTISIGYTFTNKSKKVKIEELIKKADSALYRAKELGRNRAEYS